MIASSADPTSMKTRQPAAIVCSQAASRSRSSRESPSSAPGVATTIAPLTTHHSRSSSFSRRSAPQDRRSQRTHQGLLDVGQRRSHWDTASSSRLGFLRPSRIRRLTVVARLSPSRRAASSRCSASGSGKRTLSVRNTRVDGNWPEGWCCSCKRPPNLALKGLLRRPGGLSSGDYCRRRKLRSDYHHNRVTAIAFIRRHCGAMESNSPPRQRTKTCAQADFWTRARSPPGF